MQGSGGLESRDAEEGGGRLESDEEWLVGSTLEDIRERLRVARLRAADRRRLADLTRDAGQEAFAVRLRQAADAQAATVQALEEAAARLERCREHLEEQRRWRARAAMSRQPGPQPGCVACAWRRAG